jgi:hypothetical protein
LDFALFLCWQLNRQTEIQFVILPDGKQIIRFQDWDKKYQKIFLDKLP